MVSRTPASDLPTRFVAGVVMIAIASALVWFGGVSDLGAWLYRVMVAVVAALMLIEWCDIHRVSRRWGVAGAALMVAFLLLSGEFLYPVTEIDEEISAASFIPSWQAFAAALVPAALLGLATRRVVVAWGFLYLAIPAFAALVLEWVWFGLTFWVMLVTWATDIFAYFAGRAVGGPKLAPRISPHKTWAGLAGGVAGAAVAGWLAARFFDLGMPFLWLGAPMAVLAQAGDLYESRVKRKAGVKDSGALLPGHGGMLDRLDGLLPVLAATLLLLMAGIWSG
jgi:phosphatidate cytidylyltransferase